GIVKADARNAVALTLLGGLFLSQQQPRRAEEEFRRALKADEGFAPARFELAKLALDGKREAEGIGLLQRVVRDRPGHIPATLLLARHYSRDGRYEQAVQVLDAAMQQNREMPELAVFAAEMQLKRQQYDEAIARSQRIVDASPGLVSARMVLGLAYLGKQKPLEASREFEQVNKLNPKLAPSHYYLGRALLARGDAAGARRAFEQAIAIDPGHKEARLALASASGQRPDEGVVAGQIQDLRQVLDREPTNVEARFALGRAYLVARRPKEGEAELRRVLDTIPTHAAANMALALLRLLEKKPDEAAEHFKAVLRANPKHTEANLLLANHYESRGNRLLASQHLEVASAALPARDDLKLRLATLYASLGRFDEGITRAEE